ncbi:MarR family winged helix-turn-helix transcriptional regulator [Amycolatopsis samaneae]|uniref:MarR family winged helix-turn-helix transcriptional regulator n=1 Tax=Amycolatopsis samaneae TaxID=664691 RepID=A0ABW5GHP3_9PSEU
MGNVRDLTERELETWRGFLAASTLLTRRVEQRLKDDAGLSHAQYEVLARLAAAGGCLRMTELAGAALTSKSGLTYQVARLAEAGLVDRRSCAGDDRGVLAFLTDRGRAALRAAAEGYSALVRAEFVDGLTEEQFSGLRKGIQALCAHLDNAGEPVGPPA